MEKIKHISILTLIITLGLVSCSDSENRISPLLRNTTVILNTGLPPESASADNSLLDRIRRLFVRDAVAQSAPASFSSIRVRVTGADFGVIEQTFAGGGLISLSVPSGSFRQFEVTAFTAPGDPNPAVTFRGTAAANLPAGETVSVPVLMRLSEIRIIVPDFLNGRIIVMDDMSGAGWTVIDGGKLGLDTIQPFDVDFDARGRIYIADQVSNGIIRID